MTDRLITIAQFSSYIQAEMVKQLLADHGIESVLAGENVANTYSGLPTLGQVELQTLESQAQQAKQILDKQKTQED